MNLCGDQTFTITVSVTQIKLKTQPNCRALMLAFTFYPFLNSAFV